MERTEEFVQLFNKIEKFLSNLVNAKKPPQFWQLVEIASTRNAAVRAHAGDLKQFAMLRNAIVHDADYPLQIVAVPTEEALQRFSLIVKKVVEPAPLIPTFETQVHCFSPSETLADALKFIEHHDFSQVVVKGDESRLNLLTVEGIARWFSRNLDGTHNPSDVLLQSVVALEPPGAFIVMGSQQTVFDASDAFTKSIHCKATRLYAIIVTSSGSDKEEPVGFVTPWDLVHNPRLR
jgi:CBS domain-containing protein